VAGWIVLGSLATLVALVCLMRVGVYLRFGDEPLFLQLLAGPVKIQVLPKRTKEHKAHTKKKPKKDDTGEPGDEHKKPKLSLSVDSIRDLISTMLPALKRAIVRTRRGIRIHPFQLSYVIGGLADPADKARMYGYLHILVWEAMPWLERYIAMPEPGVHLDIDFQNEKDSAAGEAGIKIRVGTLILVGISLAVPALRWYLRTRKKSGTASQNDNSRQASADKAA